MTKTETIERNTNTKAAGAHVRRRRVVAAWVLGLVLLAVGGWVGAGGEATVEAAECDELSIGVLGVQRCVVPGGQAQLDDGFAVRFDALSSVNVHWLTGHRTSHGATFHALTNLRIGDVAVYRGVSYAVAEYQLVDRHAPAAVVSWMSSDDDRLVLQTSASSPFVHVWRAEPVPTVAVDPDAPRSAVRIVESTSQPSRVMQTPITVAQPDTPATTIAAAATFETESTVTVDPQPVTQRRTISAPAWLFAA